MKTAFPELQGLPERLKAPIRKILQERISCFQSDEDVPRRLKFLAEATKNLYDEEASIEKKDAKTENQTIHTILNTASAVGNRFLVEVLIEAGADVTLLDDHSWTALMVAEAAGHKECAHVLFRHMEAIGANSTPQPLSPSRLVNVGQGGPFRFGPDNLTATLDSWVVTPEHRHAALEANNPIPINSQPFYYEITISNTGPQGYVYILSIELRHTDNISSAMSCLAY